MARGALAAGSVLWLHPAELWGRPPELEWSDASSLSVEGRGFEDLERPYDRLPVRAREIVRKPVWDLSRHSAGITVRFRTDSPRIHVRYRLTSDRLAMPHMPATGVSGVDLYAKDDAGAWRWASVVKPGARDVDAALATGLAANVREYTLYLPLYNGVESLSLGVLKGKKLEALPARTTKPIVYYGTSIAHGACASRPGMAFPSIMGRRLEWPVINLGFSGNGRMEVELAKLMGEIDAALFVVDCLPNMNAKQVTERTEPFVHALRAARPRCRVLLVEDRSFANTRFMPGLRRRHDANRKALREQFERLRSSGSKGISYFEGERLIGDDGEGSTDGSHPNDLGMMRYADALTPVVAKLVRG